MFKCRVSTSLHGVLCLTKRRNSVQRAVENAIKKILFHFRRSIPQLITMFTPSFPYAIVVNIKVPQTFFLDVDSLEKTADHIFNAKVCLRALNF